MRVFYLALLPLYLTGCQSTQPPAISGESSTSDRLQTVAVMALARSSVCKKHVRITTDKDKAFIYKLAIVELTQSVGDSGMRELVEMSVKMADPQKCQIYRSSVILNPGQYPFLEAV